MSTLIPNNRFTSAENRRIDTIPCKNHFEDRKGASTNNLYLFIKLIRLKNIHEVSIHHALHNRSIYLCIFRWFLHKISDVSATNSSVGPMLLWGGREFDIDSSSHSIKSFDLFVPFSFVFA